MTRFNSYEEAIAAGAKGTDQVFDGECGKCGGAGAITWGNVMVAGYVRGHKTEARICFDCNGKGDIWVQVNTIKARARRDVKRAAAAIEQARIDEIAQAARVAWNLQNPEFVAELTFVATRFGEGSMAYNLLNSRTEILSQTQMDSILRQAQAIHAEDAAKTPVVVGRGVVTGEVLTTKLVENLFSYYGGVTAKMLVQDDRGFKVWGTVPADISGIGRGHRVSFTATLAVSDDDASFGFFSRPVKASVIS